METSSVLFEVDCNNCLKKYTGETGRKLKEIMKEHEDDGEKSRKYKRDNWPFTTYESHCSFPCVR